ncbi:subtilisin-like protease SBT1.1 [Cajanus cajan]|uniref:subtilisin-like protease SBT1.1 n=1 Tax=Cajanus cajan TaxID=3821 RepID=UPI00098D8688|nr:subtilisin-like protease SBT1.1 [Cajanus cajan]XP_029130029.1 subtilisin-like protease SBT1.1 [Cajanus cajan]XP_029130030.1 subtilisin-like protease SBT1.1 [Cajanus cajan]
MIFRMLILSVAFMVTNSIALTEQQTYIIHIDKTKIEASIHSQDSSKPWVESIIDFISQASMQEEEEILAPRLLYTYENSMYGFAAQLSKKHLEYLNQVDGFLSAIPDELSTLHTTYTPHFLGLRNGKSLWTASNLVSEVIIGVLDSGIWPEHISFQDSGMSPVPSHWKGVCEQGTKFSSKNCNKKLIGARAYYKGYENYAGKINETVDYVSPRDSQGHGTHTASTAAGDVVKNANLFGQAKGTASGMRYTSRIAAYKVCWPSGCTNSDVLAAMDQAVSDGVDVLSLSLGTIPKPFYNDSIAIASFGATKRGVFVACSAGNSGPFPSTVANGAPWIMTVAASSTDRTFPTKVKLGNGKSFKGSSLYQGKNTNQLPLVYGKSAGPKREAQYCIEGSLDPKLVHGKIVACERGINGRTEKGEEVKVAGGAGMILLNTENHGEELFADSHILPATSLGALASKTIRSYIQSVKKSTASISFIGTRFGDPAPVMAAFSSRGPSIVGPDVIKPDVTAPGVNILAAWPTNISPSFLKSDKRRVLFNILSGTSMSCPHVSGIAALLKSLHKDWSPAAIKSALMTTAYTLNNKGAPISDMASNNSPFANPFAFGSGHVNPVSASDPGLVYDISTKDYLNYLCSINYTSSQIALLSRGNFVCSKKSVLQAGDLNYPSFAVLFGRSDLNASVTYKRVVTNVGKPQSGYAVKVEQPNGVSVTVEPRKLKFGKLGQKLSYKVTFLAVGGARVGGTSSFGSLIWVSGRYKVRSPIAVTWQ